MSFWAKVETKINDLECFKQSCRQHNIKYEANEDSNFKHQGKNVIAILTDMNEGGPNYSRQAFLVESGGGISLSLDNHVGYGSIATRLGQNGGKLVRDYTKNVIEKGVVRNGGMVSHVVENPDGSLVMKVTAL